MSEDDDNLNRGYAATRDWLESKGNDLELVDDEPLSIAEDACSWPPYVTLNADVQGEGVTPLCPDCEEEIEVEATNGFGGCRFLCGCDERRRFEMNEE